MPLELSFCRFLKVLEVFWRFENKKKKIQKNNFTFLFFFSFRYFGEGIENIVLHLWCFEHRDSYWAIFSNEVFDWVLRLLNWASRLLTGVSRLLLSSGNFHWAAKRARGVKWGRADETKEKVKAKEGRKAKAVEREQANAEQAKRKRRKEEEIRGRGYKSSYDSGLQRIVWISFDTRRRWVTCTYTYMYLRPVSLRSSPPKWTSAAQAHGILQSCSISHAYSQINLLSSMTYV